MGCGKGQACVDVARKRGAEVTGLDLSTSNIKRARECLGKNLDPLDRMLGDFLPTQVMKGWDWMGRSAKKCQKSKQAEFSDFFSGFWDHFFFNFPSHDFGGGFCLPKLGGLSGDEQPHPFFFGKTLGNNHNEADHTRTLGISWHFFMISAVGYVFVCLLLGQKTLLKDEGFIPQIRPLRVYMGVKLKSKNDAGFKTSKAVLGGGFKYFFFTPKIWGRWTQFDDHIFQVGWNHQPE